MPAPEEIREARKDAGLTQFQAAQLVHVSDRAWRMWESGDRDMSKGMWELFRLKIGTHPK